MMKMISLTEPQANMLRPILREKFRLLVEQKAVFDVGHPERERITREARQISDLLAELGE